MLPIRAIGDRMLTLDSLAAEIWGDTGDVRFIADWRALAEAREIPAGDEIVRQLHPADAVHILRSGEVNYGLALEGSRESLTIGTDSRPGLPLGWSAMVAPNRYATSAQAITDCALFAWPIAALQALFDRRLVRKKLPAVGKTIRRNIQNRHY